MTFYLSLGFVKFCVSEESFKVDSQSKGIFQRYMFINVLSSCRICKSEECRVCVNVLYIVIFTAQIWV